MNLQQVSSINVCFNRLGPAEMGTRGVQVHLHTTGIEILLAHYGYSLLWAGAGTIKDSPAGNPSTYVNTASNQD